MYEIQKRTFGWYVILNHPDGTVEDYSGPYWFRKDAEEECSKLNS